MALHDQAMLANLSISQWDARKFDKKATQEVEAKHGALKAGRFNKLLIDDSALEPISKLAGVMRRYHDKVTLPWGDNGDRLLPSRAYMDYVKAMRDFKQQFHKEVSILVNAYPGLVQSARMRLGTLYEPRDYPTPEEVRAKFNVDTTFMPVPSAKDFRVDVAAEDVEELRAGIAKKIQERQAGAVEDALGRAKLFVTRVRDTLSTDKPRIFESLMDNLTELIHMLPAFNVMGDPKLDDLEAQLKTLVHPTAVLKNRPEVRTRVAREAGTVLARFGWA